MTTNDPGADAESAADDGAGATPAGDPPDIEANIKSRSTWMRLVFMLVLGAIYALSRLVVFSVVVLQFLWALITSEANEKLVRFGHSLAVYTAELIDYLCYYSEERPFPFDRDWPAG